MKLRIMMFMSAAILSCTPKPSANAEEDEKAIRAIMNNQVACWNKGDLDCFMEGYLKSDALMFIGKNGITYGYDNTLERYHTTYPGPDAMGTLNFDILHLNRLSPEYYSMIGRWHLDRNDGNIQGYFSLLFRKIDGIWVIIKDHSS